MRALSDRPAFAMRALPNAVCFSAMVMPGRLRAEVLRGVQGEGAPAAADVEHLVAGAEHELAAHEVDLVVLRLLERLVLVAEEARRVDHAVAEEGLEEVVAAVVVLADDALVLRLRVDGHLGDHPRDEELHVVARERVRDEAVARLEERVHVGDVDVAVEVRLEEGGHGDLRAGITSLRASCRGRRRNRSAGSRVCLFFVVVFRAEYGRQKRTARRDHMECHALATSASGSSEKETVCYTSCVASYAMRTACVRSRHGSVMERRRARRRVAPTRAQESQLDGLPRRGQGEPDGPVGGACPRPCAAASRPPGRGARPSSAAASACRAAKPDVLVQAPLGDRARAHGPARLRPDDDRVPGARQAPGRGGRGARVRGRRASALAAIDRGADRDGGGAREGPTLLRGEGGRGARGGVRPRRREERGGVPRGDRAARRRRSSRTSASGGCSGATAGGTTASPSCVAPLQLDPNGARRALRARRGARASAPRASTCSSTRRASGRRSPTRGSRSATQQLAAGRMAERARQAAEARSAATRAASARRSCVGQGGARRGARRRRDPRGRGGAEARRQLGAGEAPRRRRQREEGRDRSRARGLPGRVGARSRRPDAARARVRGVPRRRPRHEREGLRAEGRAGVPEVGPGVGRARRRARRAGREAGGEGRVPEGARRRRAGRPGRGAEAS